MENSDWVKIDGCTTAHILRNSVSFVQIIHESEHDRTFGGIVHKHWIKIVSNGDTNLVEIRDRGWLETYRKFQADVGIDQNKD